MASLTDYQAYHNYVVGAVAGFTAVGKSVFIAGETDAAGIPLTEVKLELTRQQRIVYYSIC